jgi:hypothetical protein
VGFFGRVLIEIDDAREKADLGSPHNRRESSSSDRSQTQAHITHVFPSK